MSKATLAVLAILLASSASTGDVVLPGYAWNLEGKDGNLWFSEVHITNLGPTEASVTLSRALLGRMDPNHQRCLPPLRPYVVPARTTLALCGLTLLMDLGCPQMFVGGLVFTTTGSVLVASRMVNDRGALPEVESGLRGGLGQEIPGTAVADLPASGSTMMLPGLVWHPNPCGPPRVETYVHFANPAAAPVRVLLRTAGAPAPVFAVDGAEIGDSYSFTVPASGWRQLLIGPAGIRPAVCMKPEIFDLFYEADGQLAAYASVVDRESQDPRTVLPVAVK